VDPIVRDTAVAAVLLSGILAGLSLDKVIVQLPARRRMGAVGYPGYARAADLGNGVVFYAVAGIGAAVLTVAAFGLALARGTPETRFARWSAVRAALQVATFVVVVAAVTAGRASVPSGRVALYPSVSG
jgi:hypothetical protein